MFFYSHAPNIEYCEILRRLNKRVEEPQLMFPGASTFKTKLLEIFLYLSY